MTFTAYTGFKNPSDIPKSITGKIETAYGGSVKWAYSPNVKAYNSKIPKKYVVLVVDYSKPKDILPYALLDGVSLKDNWLTEDVPLKYQFKFWENGHELERRSYTTSPTNYTIPFTNPFITYSWAAQFYHELQAELEKYTEQKATKQKFVVFPCKLFIYDSHGYMMVKGEDGEYYYKEIPEGFETSGTGNNADETDDNSDETPEEKENQNILYIAGALMFAIILILLMK